MIGDVDYWKCYWEGKKDPLHSKSDTKYYEKYGKELSILLPSKINSILELGCGTGSLYKALGFNKAKSYVGVDLSRSMLDEFEVSYPGVSLCEGSADSYLDENKYEIIFTNGVVQYLSISSLRGQIANALEMLSDDGVIVHASIPWMLMKKHFYYGRIMPPYRSKEVKPKILYWATRVGIKKDQMGKWFSVKDFECIAKDFDLKANYFGSALYPYRFHVTLKKNR